MMNRVSLDRLALIPFLLEAREGVRAMKKMTRKLFACLLAMMLALNMIPLAVFATDGNGEGNVVGADDTQSSGSQQFNLLGLETPQTLVYNLDGKDSIKLSEMLASIGMTDVFAENGYYRNDY